MSCTLIVTLSTTRPGGMPEALRQLQSMRQRATRWEACSMSLKTERNGLLIIKREMSEAEAMQVAEDCLHGTGELNMIAGKDGGVQAISVRLGAEEPWK